MRPACQVSSAIFAHRPVAVVMRGGGEEADVGEQIVHRTRDAERCSAVASRGAAHRSDPCGRPHCSAVAGLHAPGPSRRGRDAGRIAAECPRHHSRDSGHTLGGRRRDACRAPRHHSRGGLRGQGIGRPANQRGQAEHNRLRAESCSPSWLERAEDFPPGPSHRSSGQWKLTAESASVRLRSVRYVSALPSTRGEAMSFPGSVMLVVYPQACAVGRGAGPGPRSTRRQQNLRV